MNRLSWWNSREDAERKQGTIPRGIWFAALTAFISGFAVYIGAYGVKEFPSAAVYTTVRNTIVGLMLLALSLRPTALQEMWRLTPRQRIGLVLLGIVGGSVPFVLFFEGLSRTGSANGAFLQKTLFLWVALLAVIFLRERLGGGQILALGLLLVAQVFSGGPSVVRLGSGEMLVLGATLFWSTEVVVAKRLLAGISSSLGATARMAVGAVILLCYLGITGKLGIIGQLSLTQWAWAIGPSILLFGYVTTWYAALKRAPATTVTCVLTLGAPITAVLSALAGSGLPRLEGLQGYTILIAAVVIYAFYSLRGAASRSATGHAVAQGDA
jgi:drug/metabolite transporter (DMT)-like permease